MECCGICYDPFGYGDKGVRDIRVLCGNMHMVCVECRSKMRLPSGQICIYKCQGNTPVVPPRIFHMIVGHNRDIMDLKKQVSVETEKHKSVKRKYDELNEQNKDLTAQLAQYRRRHLHLLHHHRRLRASAPTHDWQEQMPEEEGGGDLPSWLMEEANN